MLGIRKKDQAERTKEVAIHMEAPAKHTNGALIRTILKLTNSLAYFTISFPGPQSSPIKCLAFRLYNTKKGVFLGVVRYKLYSTRLFDMLKIVLKIPIIV